MTPLRQNILFVAIAIMAAAIFVMTVIRVEPDHMAMGMIVVVIVFALKDIRSLVAGWFWISPYFYPFGTKGEANIASNFSHNVIVPVIAVITLLFLFVKERKLHFGKEEFIWLAFVAYAIVSSFLATGGRYDDVRMIYLIYLLPFMLYLVVKNLDIDSNVMRMFAYVSIFHLIVLAMMAAYEYVTDDVLYQSAQNWADVGSGRRFAGPFGSPIVVGIFVPVCFLYIYMAYKLDRLPRYVLWCSGFIATILTVLTFTRSVWLGAFLAFVYIMYSVGKEGGEKLMRLAMFVTAAAALVGVMTVVSPAIQERLAGEENANFRIVMAEASINMILDKPVVGWGFGTFDEVSDRYLFDARGVYITKDTSHVTLLTILAEVGVVGALMYLLFFFVHFRNQGVALRDLPPDDLMIVAANMGGVIAFAINAFLIDMRFYSIAYSWFFVNLGFIYKIYKDNMQSKVELS